MKSYREIWLRAIILLLVVNTLNRATAADHSSANDRARAGSSFDARIDKDISPIQQKVTNGSPLTEQEKMLLTEWEAQHPSQNGSNPLDNQGGQDGYGYAYVDNLSGDTATYAWIELRGDPQATWLNAADFSSVDDGMTNSPIVIGFDFPFYGQSFGQCRIGTNGDVQFTTSYSFGHTTCLPRINSGAMLTPFATDLHLQRGGIPSGNAVVGYRNFGTYWVLEFDSIGFYNTTSCPNGSLKHEAILFSTGRMKFQYNHLVIPTGCYDTYAPNIGIQASGIGPDLVYSCGQSGIFPVANQAVWFFVPDAVPNPVTNLQGTSGGTTTVTLTWTDPDHFTNGDPLTPDSILIYRSNAQPGSQIAHVAGGVQTIVLPNQPTGIINYFVRVKKAGAFNSAPSGTALSVGDPNDFAANLSLTAIGYGECTDPHLAIDGDTQTSWNSCGFSGTLTIALRQPSTVDSLRLFTIMTPGGNAHHIVSVSADSLTWTTIADSTGAWLTEQWWRLSIPSNLNPVKYVKINTPNSVSWVSWGEVQIWGRNAPATGTYICGNVSGVWDSTRSPYYVVCDVTVPAGQTLIIEPGVDVRMSDTTRFAVYGTLKVLGESNDSVLFTQGLPGSSPWWGIDVGPSAACSLSYSTIERATTNNDNGGGLYSNYANVFLKHTTIRQCTANMSGGAFYCTNGSFSADSCLFQGNHGVTSVGGGFLQNHFARLSHCDFVTNWTSGSNVGALYCYNDSTQFECCNFRGNYNTATMTIGDNILVYNPSGTAYATFDGCAFTDNFGYSSGSVLTVIDRATVVLNRCVIARNHVSVSEVEAGAIYLSGGNLTVNNCTFNDNTVAYAGVGSSIGFTGGTLTGANNVLWNSNPVLQISGTGNLTYSDIQGGYAGTGNINANPLFANVTNGDFHLQAGSPCIDSGNPSSPLDPDGTRADMGAYPYFHPNPCGSVSGAWDSTGSPYYINCDVTVPAGETLAIGPGVHVLFTGHYKFNVLGNLQATGTEQDSIVFTRAFPTEESKGWGIRFYDADPACSLAYCVVEDFHATPTNPSTGSGGGVYMTQSSPVLFRCAIRDNVADYDGGGIGCYDGCSPQITECSIENNVATGDAGGVLFHTNCGPVVSRCTVRNNTANGNAGGGGVFNHQSTVTMMNCTVIGNNALTGDGGGIENRGGGSTYLDNCIVWGNAALIGAQVHVFDGTCDVTYSDLQGGYSGIGNIYADPMFANTTNGDFHLQAGSPCIDTGDPNSPHDPDSTRADMGAFPFTHPSICGNVSGIWTLVNSPYLVTCNVIVPAGLTLSIEPGVQVKFVGNYYMQVDGNLIAEGTAADSITFWADTLTNPARWMGVRFNHAQGQDRLSYCKFLNGSCITGDAYQLGGAVFADSSLVKIAHCLFANNRAQWGGAVNLSNSLAGTTVDSSIFIHNSSVEGGAGGGACLTGATTPVRHCLFAHNSGTYGGALALRDGSVERCTFVDNTATVCGGIAYLSNGSHAFNSCIFSQNGTTPLFQRGASISVTVNYSDVQDMDGGFSNLTAPPNFGVKSHVNVNGDSVDVYDNLFRNPVFQGTEDYGLAWNSPCIDAGDSTLAREADGTIADQGWKSYYQPTLTADPPELNFGQVILGDSVALDLSLTNSSPARARLAGYCRWYTCFYVDYSSFPAWVPAASTITLRVICRPDTEGTYDDILTINSRLAGPDQLLVPMHATAASMPVPPESLVVQRTTGNDILLNWTPVTHSTIGRPLTPSYYTIYAATSPNGPYVPIGSSTTTSFLHTSIVQTQLKYFYRVTADVGTTVDAIETSRNPRSVTPAKKVSTLHK